MTTEAPLNVGSDQEVSQPQPKWQPLSAIERRVVGVLVEKAKTTPDGYPLSLNALTIGCNQKSNRDPLMNLDADQVEESLEQLRARGAVGEVLGGGRVAKYRHYMKEWLGVDGTELAVMAELLLRGAQTVGELRGRAARMAAGQLPDLDALRPVLKSLEDQGLVLPLTREGRGQIVSHALYQPEELDELRRRYEPTASAAPSGPDQARPAYVVAHASISSAPPISRSTDMPYSSNDVKELREEVARMRAEVDRLRKELEDVWANLR
jgi:hypothetical protein